MRGQSLAAEFQHVNAEVIAVVERCTAEEWRLSCAREGWSVGVVAHHIANGYDQDGRVALLVDAVVHGLAPPEQPPPGYNEHPAELSADCTIAETATLLRRNGDAGGALIAPLSETDLARTLQTSGGGPPRTLEILFRQIFIDHAREHLASIRETLAAHRSRGETG
jgi:hypothetical protein